MFIAAFSHSRKVEATQVSTNRYKNRYTDTLTKCRISIQWNIDL